MRKTTSNAAPGKLKQTAFASFVVLLRPVARLMLRCGVTSKELSELVKLVFVDVATQDYGKHGRPANASRVAILTGLSRREVKRVRDLFEGRGDAVFTALETINHGARVLSGWHQDPAFLDRNGKPRLLPLQGDRSFEALIKKYAPDIPPTAMLKELRHVGAIRETPTGRIRAMARNFIPASLDPDSIARTGSVIYDIGNSLAHNYLDDRKRPRFERRATNFRVKRSAKRAFQEHLGVKGMEFLEEIDSWLSAHEASDADEKTIRLGTGVYLIMDD